MSLPDLTYRRIEARDLDIFYTWMHDEAIGEAGVSMFDDPTNRNAFDAYWHDILRDDSIHTLTASVGDHVAGYVVVVPNLHVWELTFRVAHEYHDRGIGMAAVKQSLQPLTGQPVVAYVERQNRRAIRVLEGNGFVPVIEHPLEPDTCEGDSTLIAYCLNQQTSQEGWPTPGIIR